jgi:hypothetical protein
VASSGLPPWRPRRRPPFGRRLCAPAGGASACCTTQLPLAIELASGLDNRWLDRRHSRKLVTEARDTSGGLRAIRLVHDLVHDLVCCAVSAPMRIDRALDLHEDGSCWRWQRPDSASACTMGWRLCVVVVVSSKWRCAEMRLRPIGSDCSTRAERAGEWTGDDEQLAASRDRALARVPARQFARHNVMRPQTSTGLLWHSDWRNKSLASDGRRRRAGAVRSGGASFHLAFVSRSWPPMGSWRWFVRAC